MNILVMDDDEYIVDSIKMMVDWESLGIDGVFSASSVSQAKQIFEAAPVQIALCDIEMRNESGLDFVQWLREQGSRAQVIFLTSYAEFSYAQKAISLGSYEYLLKPIQYKKLEKILAAAVQHAVEADKGEKELENWKNSYNFRQEGFWKQLLRENMGESKEKILLKGRQLGMPYTEKDRFVGLFIEIFDFRTILEKLERGMYDFVIQNITRELLEKKGFLAEAVFRTDQEDASRWNVILWRKEEMTEVESRESLQKISRDYIWMIRKHLNSIVGCYIGSMVPLWQIPTQIRKMEQMVKSDVLGANQVQFLADYRVKELSYVKPEFDQWKEYLINREISSLMSCVEQYLRHMESKGEVNAETLERFQTEFNQMVFSVLEIRNISVDLLWDQVNLEAGREAVKSIWNMKKYTKSLIGRAVGQMELVEKSRSVVDIVKRYMEEHYMEDLTREDLAKQVFLSPDYLAKLFRYEEKESIGNYLTRCRIEKAKEQLRNTKEPIHRIACDVGYTNFSYFAKLFRKFTGYTPNEYRRGEEDNTG